MTGLHEALLKWYAEHGRSHLAWRVVRDPYYTLVSEMMLQQTQVDRVIPKFAEFVRRLPDFESLAAASVADVLRLWQGLGYNSRAIRLKNLAEIVVRDHGGRMPSDEAALKALPGVGPYTQAAIRAFGFDLDDAPVDTNIRRVVHRLFFGLEHPPQATPRQLDTRARGLVPAGAAHDWNSALMDLGAAICTARAPKCRLCPLSAACVAAPIDAVALETARRKYAKKRSPQQAIPFEETTRYARGRIVDRLRALAPGQRISLLDLHRELKPVMPERSYADVEGLVAALARDGLVARDGERVALRE